MFFVSIVKLRINSEAVEIVHFARTKTNKLVHLKEPKMNM